MKFAAFLNSLPTTKIRILVSLMLSVFVIVAAILNQYTPTYEILAYLLLSMGIDVAQYKVKQGNTPTEKPE